MIITEKKPHEEILQGLSGKRKVALLGCGRCATSCRTGGEREVAQMRKSLEAEGFAVVYSGVVEAQCDERLTRLTLKDMADAEVIVSMSCGSGASALADLTVKPVVPSNNTMFLGVVRRIGEYSQRCSMCGICELPQTAGVCVKTRCAKGLLNGPCGGAKNGKCEVDGVRDCAWALAVERLGKAGRIGELTAVRKKKRARK